MGDLRMLDATDPDEWGPAVERVAEKMAERMWGAPHWYRGVANDVLTAAFNDTDEVDLDPKDTQRVCQVYFDQESARQQDGGEAGE